MLQDGIASLPDSKSDSLAPDTQHSEGAAQPEACWAAEHDAAAAPKSQPEADLVADESSPEGQPSLGQDAGDTHGMPDASDGHVKIKLQKVDVQSANLHR